MSMAGKQPQVWATDVCQLLGVTRGTLSQFAQLHFLFRLQGISTAAVPATSRRVRPVILQSRHALPASTTAAPTNHWAATTDISRLATASSGGSSSSSSSSSSSEPEEAAVVTSALDVLKQKLCSNLGPFTQQQQQQQSAPGDEASIKSWFATHKASAMKARYLRVWEKRSQHAAARATQAQQQLQRKQEESISSRAREAAEAEQALMQAYGELEPQYEQLVADSPVEQALMLNTMQLLLFQTRSALAAARKEAADAAAQRDALEKAAGNHKELEERWVHEFNELESDYGTLLEGATDLAVAFVSVQQQSSAKERECQELQQVLSAAAVAAMAAAAQSEALFGSSAAAPPIQAVPEETDLQLLFNDCNQNQHQHQPEWQQQDEEVVVCGEATATVTASPTARPLSTSHDSLTDNTPAHSNQGQGFAQEQSSQVGDHDAIWYC